MFFVIPRDLSQWLMFTALCFVLLVVAFGSGVSDLTMTGRFVHSGRRCHTTLSVPLLAQVRSDVLLLREF